jgi:protein SCO1/2
MKPIIAILAPVGVVVLVGAAWWLTRSTSADQFAACRTTEIGTGIDSIGGPFTLVDENGKTVTDADVFTKPTLLYFGYTFCPDVCPMDSSRNADALDLLQERGYDAQAVFISVDPERDTPERVLDFTDLMHDDMIGLTGSLEQVKVASQAYKTYFRKEEDGDPEYYLVDHSTFTYLVLPEQGFVEFFRRDDTPEGMADRTACFIDAAK